MSTSESIAWVCRIKSARNELVDFLPPGCGDLHQDAVSAHVAAQRAAYAFIMSRGIERTPVTLKVEMWRAADETIKGVRPEIYGMATIQNAPK
jgi:hypothetical protein